MNTEELILNILKTYPTVTGYFNGTRIAREIGKDRMTTSRALAVLEARGLIKATKVGMQKVWSLI